MNCFVRVCAIVGAYFCFIIYRGKLCHPLQSLDWVNFRKNTLYHWSAIISEGEVLVTYCVLFVFCASFRENLKTRCYVWLWQLDNFSPLVCLACASLPLYSSVLPWTILRSLTHINIVYDLLWQKQDCFQKIGFPIVGSSSVQHYCRYVSGHSMDKICAVSAVGFLVEFLCPYIHYLCCVLLVLDVLKVL